ncbi:MAG: hypothetical protein ACT4PG_05360 [Panacagrimonas sp.]
MAEEAAVEETAAEAEAPAEEAPAADAALVDAAAAPAEDSAETTAEAPEEVAEEAADEVADAGEPEDSSDLDSDEGLGLDLYVGVEFDQTTVDLQNEGLGNAFGSNRFDSDFYKLRLGARIADGIGVELHAGFPAHDAGEGEVETKQFYAFYFVPTGVLFNTLEVSARLGYAMTSLENELTDDDFDGMSFGLAAELPIRLFGEGLPNLRFGVGATVYQEDNEARVYGFHGGLRFDFSI